MINVMSRYSRVALLLGMLAVFAGCWLCSLEYQLMATGPIAAIFGCNVLFNDNNIAPGLFFVIVGAFVALMSPSTRREAQDSVSKRTRSGQTIAENYALILGFLSSIFGVVLAENGGNGCPPDWVTNIVSDERMFQAGVVFFIVGFVMIVVSRVQIWTQSKLKTRDGR